MCTRPRALIKEKVKAGLDTQSQADQGETALIYACCQQNSNLCALYCSKRKPMGKNQGIDGV